MHRIDGAGHVDHLFVPEDPETLRPPTEITPEIMNAFQEELAMFIEWALGAGSLNKSDNTQLKQGLLAKFAGIDSAATKAGVQGQTYTAFTTAGVAGAFTLTPVPAIAAYAAGQRFRVKFHAAGTGADVLNIGALGNKSLKQYDNTGAKVAAVVAANQLVDVEYDGVDMMLLDPLPSQVLKNLAVVTATGNWVVPAGIFLVDVELWGGGGGGGGSGSGGGTSGGGGAGGYARGTFQVTPGQVIACTIGAAGSGSGPGGSGGSGGTTSFGAMMSATGGGGGALNPSGNGGNGGAGTGGLINITASGGSTGAASNVQGGNGASAPFGGGGGGGAQGSAGAGAVPGGGGGGGGSSSAGGAGARGQIHIRY